MTKRRSKRLAREHAEATNDRRHIDKKRAKKKRLGSRQKKKKEEQIKVQRLTQLLQQDLDRIKAVRAAQLVSRAESIPLTSPFCRAKPSLTDFLYLVLPEEFLDRLTVLAHARLQERIRNNKKEPKLKMVTRRLVEKFIASEWLYSESKKTSYKEFRAAEPDDSLSVGINLRKLLRSLVVAHLTEDEVLELEKPMMEACRRIQLFAANESIDELLSAWKSVKAKDNTTHIERKPHKDGYCYYLRVVRWKEDDHTILFCRDWVESVFKDKTAACLAAQKLMLRSDRYSLGLRPAVILDRAFFSKKMIEWANASGHFVVLAGGEKLIPQMAVLAERKLPRHHHLLLHRRDGLIISLVNAARDQNSGGSSDPLPCIKVAVSNAFSVKSVVSCICSSAVALDTAKLLEGFSDDILDHMMFMRAETPGTRAHNIKRISGCANLTADKQNCPVCMHNDNFRTVSTEEYNRKAKEEAERLNKEHKVAALKRMCVDKQLKTTGLKMDLCKRLAEAALMPENSLKLMQQRAENMFDSVSSGQGPISELYRGEFNPTDRFNALFYNHSPNQYKGAPPGKYLLDLLAIAKLNAYALYQIHYVCLRKSKNIMEPGSFIRALANQWAE